MLLKKLTLIVSAVLLTVPLVHGYQFVCKPYVHEEYKQSLPQPPEDMNVTAEFDAVYKNNNFVQKQHCFVSITDGEREALQDIVWRYSSKMTDGQFEALLQAWRAHQEMDSIEARLFKDLQRMGSLTDKIVYKIVGPRPERLRNAGIVR